MTQGKIIIKFWIILKSLEMPKVSWFTLHLTHQTVKADPGLIKKGNLEYFAWMIKLILIIDASLPLIPKYSPRLVVSSVNSLD